MSPQYNSQNKLAPSKEITDYPVLIVGGSLVGLSTALFLSSRGIPSILIERHQSTSNHPRAAGYNLRTMELFRSVGLEQIIHDAGPQYDRKWRHIGSRKFYRKGDRLV